MLALDAPSFVRLARVRYLAASALAIGTVLCLARGAASAELIGLGGLLVQRVRRRGDRAAERGG
jgi:hypothetical protein